MESCEQLPQSLLTCAHSTTVISFLTRERHGVTKRHRKAEIEKYRQVGKQRQTWEKQKQTLRHRDTKAEKQKEEWRETQTWKQKDSEETESQKRHTDRDREADADRDTFLPAQTTSLRQVCFLRLKFMLLQRYKPHLTFSALNSAHA